MTDKVMTEEEMFKQLKVIVLNWKEQMHVEWMDIPIDREFAFALFAFIAPRIGTKINDV